MSNMITISTPMGDMAAAVGVPDGDGPWPGVLVVHDALGMTVDLRRQVDWLASEGFLAIAPDLFWWGSRPRCTFRTMQAIVRREGRAFDDLAATRVHLAARPDCTGRIGVVGFCMGGGIAILLASFGDYGAASVNYGRVPRDAVTLLADACPVVGSFGGRDTLLPKAAARLEQALAANGIAHDVEVYPDAGHAFLNDHESEDMPLWGAVLGPLASTGLHEPSASHARRRITAFLDAHLRD